MRDAAETVLVRASRDEPAREADDDDWIFVLPSGEGTARRAESSAVVEPFRVFRVVVDVVRGRLPSTAGFPRAPPAETLSKSTDTRLRGDTDDFFASLVGGVVGLCGFRRAVNDSI